ncbi:MAG TPA: energy coupling factor transporter S component ThiW [Candidatus Acidoferrum sp.]|nr:energy coupling factor transporter S component ThiW [Candidatus Acidoferrum sp.]
MKSQDGVFKLTFLSLAVAAGVALSPFSIPLGVAKAFPVQHAVNVLLGVLLGPIPAVGAAFVTSLIRVMMGTGTLLAFPGSMIGAYLGGWLYQKSRGKILFAFAGEVIGTGLLGALAAYPVAAFVMSRDVALYAFVLPFTASCAVGAAISVVLVMALRQAGVLDMMQRRLKPQA